MALRLPSPMLARSGSIPTGDYAFEVKWDGFRALVSRNGDFQVRSRRGWNMTALLPELADLPAEAILDGEIVASADGRPHFPLVCDRLLHRDKSIPLTYVIFDLLALDGEPTMSLLYRERRELLGTLSLGDGPWFIAETFDDGEALFEAVCDQGMEGIVAKRRSQRYRPGDRAWIKTKNKGVLALRRGVGVAAAVAGAASPRPPAWRPVAAVPRRRCGRVARIER
jgi:bifunctional non-homologous end joining protein LigD